MNPYRIWKDVDELAFHENNIILELLGRSQGTAPPKLLSSRNPVKNDSHLDGLEWVPHFLDDFALVAAGAGGASNVAAACLELNEIPGNCFIIRVAKNEDLSFAQLQCLKDIVTIMNQVKQRDIQTSEAEKECFDVIARSCRARILKLVNGPKGLRELAIEQSAMSAISDTLPKYRFTAQSSESRADVENLGEYNSSTHVGYMRLSQGRWTQMLAIASQMSSSTEHQVIKSLASLAYEVRRSMSFRTMLEQLSRRGSGHVSRIIEKIGKIARFYRSAITFVRAAEFGRNSDGFAVELVSSKLQSVNVLSSRTVDDLNKRLPPSSLKLKTHVSEARRLLRRWKRYIVHAEMLLLLFYEEHPEISKVKNYIGISKRSCFLCANFIRFHDVFTMEGDHNQLYCLWTLPVFVTFQDETRRKRLSKALRDLCRLVEEKKAAICALSYRPFPYNTESVANFSRLSLLKWPGIPEQARTATNLNLNAVLPVAAHSYLTKCQDITGILQEDRPKASLEPNTAAPGQAFSQRSGDTAEVSETDCNVPQNDGKQDVEDEEVALPRKLEALGAISTTHRKRPHKKRRQKRHRSGHRYLNYQLPTTREQAKDNRITWHRPKDERLAIRKPPRRTKVRQDKRQRKRNSATQNPGRVILNHGNTKSKLSRADEGEESGCLPIAFSCLWLFRMLFQCAVRHNGID